MGGSSQWGGGAAACGAGIMPHGAGGGGPAHSGRPCCCMGGGGMPGPQPAAGPGARAGGMPQGCRGGPATLLCCCIPATGCCQPGGMPDGARDRLSPPGSCPEGTGAAVWSVAATWPAGLLPGWAKGSAAAAAIPPADAASASANACCGGGRRGRRISTPGTASSGSMLSAALPVCAWAAAPCLRCAGGGLNLIVTPPDSSVSVPPACSRKRYQCAFACLQRECYNVVTTATAVAECSRAPRQPAQPTSLSACFARCRAWSAANCWRRRSCSRASRASSSASSALRLEGGAGGRLWSAAMHVGITCQAACAAEQGEDLQQEAGQAAQLQQISVDRPPNPHCTSAAPPPAAAPSPPPAAAAPPAAG